MHKLLQWLVAVVLVITTTGCSEVRNFFKRDACLDRGGRWDYQYERCVHATPENPNPPYQKPQTR